MVQTTPIQRSEYEWEIPATGRMRVPVIIYADADLIQEMDSKVFEQAINVATLPGIVKASYAMPDAHWGYGFPIGGVAAFDPEQDGVVSAGGVGFDISCGVRTLLTGLKADAIEQVKKELLEQLFYSVPAGLGSTGNDLQRIEEQGRMEGAMPDAVSKHAKQRQRDEMGTLGSGNHYLEVQVVTGIFDQATAEAFGLALGDVVISIHCGSRGLGHQIGTEFLKKMVTSASQHGIRLPDRELACAPINSHLGKSYLGAMRAGINCALANRQIITHLTRKAFARVLPDTRLDLLYDVSHNTCKVEKHTIDGVRRRYHVHRKGATRAFGPGHRDLPEAFRKVGQPVLIGGSMGTASFILAGTREGEERAFSSACHGAGRAMSRRAATKRWRGRNVVDELASHGILIRSPSMRGVAEEAPGAYKDVTAVVDASDSAGLARKIVRLEPMACVKG
jgi:tRNA-splicing ligase RtcB